VEVEELGGKYVCFGLVAREAVPRSPRRVGFFGRIEFLPRCKGRHQG
jgi:hypothetical protein